MSITKNGIKILKAYSVKGGGKNLCTEFDGCCDEVDCIECPFLTNEHFEAFVNVLVEGSK